MSHATVISGNGNVRFSASAYTFDAALSGSDGVKVVHSPVGHDGFLVESGQLIEFMQEFERSL